MESSCEDTAATCQATPHVTANVAVPPSLWRSVRQAFRQAQLARLEARLRRIRQSVSGTSTLHEHSVMLVSSDQGHHDGATWMAMPTTRPRRRWSLVVTIALITVTGMSLSVAWLSNRVTTADVSVPLPESPLAHIVRDTAEVRALLTQLDERVTMLQHQVLQHGDQLTTQAVTMLRVTQQADLQQTQVTALTETLAALTSQVAHVEQQVTTAETRLAAHEQQLATQATPLGPVRTQARDVGRVRPTATAHASRPGPPTLEVFAPPSSQAVTPVRPMSQPLPTPPVHAAGHAITLPAALGATRFGAVTDRAERTSP